MLSVRFGLSIVLTSLILFIGSAIADESVPDLRDLFEGSTPTLFSMTGSQRTILARNNPSAKVPDAPRSGFLGLGITEKEPKKKSPKKAFFLSALLPGLGEFYAGSKKGFIFMAIEAAAMYTYFKFNSEGKDIETKFRDFANAHWIYSDYEQWLVDRFDAVDPLLMQGITHEDSMAVISANEEISRDSQGNPIKNQQYYEMIGKYDQFVYAWDDVIEDPRGYPAYNDSALSIKRDNYESLRNDSNKKLKTRDNGLKVMLLNRAISAIDAARFAWKRNQSLEAAQNMVRMKVAIRKEGNHETMMLLFTKRF